MPDCSCISDGICKLLYVLLQSVFPPAETERAGDLHSPWVPEDFHPAAPVCREHHGMRRGISDCRHHRKPPSQRNHSRDHPAPWTDRGRLGAADQSGSCSSEPDLYCSCPGGPSAVQQSTSPQDIASRPGEDGEEKGRSRCASALPQRQPVSSSCLPDTDWQWI